MPLSKLPDEPFAPVVIGVIGRRLLRSEYEARILRSALVREINAFKEAYRPAPIIVTTSLAPGADTLAAEAADACGVSLRAILPMEAKFYREGTSFGLENVEKARAEFDRWLKEPTQVVTLKPPEEWGGPPADWSTIASSEAKEHHDYRTRLFAYAGVHVVNRCDVLIALWDGETDAPSFTGGLVSLRLDGIPPDALKSLPGEPLGVFSERGPAVILHAPRIGSTSAKPVGAREVRTPSRVVLDEATGVPLGPAGKRTFGITLRDDEPLARSRTRWDAFVEWLSGNVKKDAEAAGAVLRWLGLHELANTICKPFATAIAWAFDRLTKTTVAERADQRWARYERRLQRRRCWTLAKATQDFQAQPANGESSEIDRALSSALLPVEAVEALGPILRTRAAASATASALDRWLVLFQAATFLLIFASLFFFHLYAHWFDMPSEVGGHPHHHAWPLEAAVGAIVVALAVAVVAAVKDFHRRRLEYRALAEALRVRLWWHVAGVTKSVALAYPGQVRSEVAWIRQAVRNLNVRPRGWWEEGFVSASEKNKEARLKTVRDHWIAGQVGQHFRARRNIEARGVILRQGGFAIAAAGWVWMLLLLRHPAFPTPLDLVSAGVLTILGGLMIGYSQQRTHEELCNQYRRAHLVFRNGLREFDAKLAAKDWTGAQAICEALGTEAINENGQWLMLRSAKPLEVPVA